jgi:hypothetical protein
MNAIRRNRFFVPNVGDNKGKVGVVEGWTFDDKRYLVRFDGSKSTLLCHKNEGQGFVARDDAERFAQQQQEAA